MARYRGDVDARELKRRRDKFVECAWLSVTKAYGRSVQGDRTLVVEGVRGIGNSLGKPYGVTFVAYGISRRKRLDNV
jgi:hypothetical protein